jgi:tetratricopeptide (TPR) repeat protein
MADIFISYVHEDRAEVRSLVGALRNHGWSVWWDPELVPGEHYDRVIERELDAAKCIIVVWSRTSLVSANVRNEAVVGRQRGWLVQITIGGASYPSTFAGWQAVDLSAWTGDTTDRRFQELCSGVHRLVVPITDRDHKLFAAYLVQRDCIGIKPGAKPGEMMAAMIGEPTRRTDLANVLLADWKSWFDQPEHARPKERIVQCRVSPTSSALLSFALFLNEAIAKLLKEDLGQPKPTTPKYLAVGVEQTVGQLFKRIREGRDAEAQAGITECDRLLRDNALDPELYVRRGYHHAALKAFDKALADFDRALQLRPKSAAAHVGRGWVFKGQGLTDKAIAECHKTLAIEPSSEGAHALLEILGVDNAPIDLSRPQELIDAITAAHDYARQRNESFSVQSVLAGPYGPRVIKALESVCHECALRKTPQILVPLDDAARSPLRQVVSDLFKAPDKISPNIKRNAVPYEIDFRPDLVTPRTRVQELTDAVRAALLHAQQNGIAATREAILAGPHGARVRKAFESVCEEYRERRTQRIILPMKYVAADPVRKILVQLFKSPSKVSSKIQVSVAFELECAAEGLEASGY